MPSFNPEIDFEVFCSCGAGLCSQSTTEERRGSWRVIVEPCSRCLDQAHNDGYDEGYEAGQP